MNWPSAIAVVVLCAAAGCSSTPKHVDSIYQVEIVADRYLPELYDALYEDHEALERVGAPMTYPRQIEVGFVNGTKKIGDQWAVFLESHQTWVDGYGIGKKRVIVLTDRGAFQRKSAGMEMLHPVVRGNEAQDYAWYRKGGLMR